VENPLVAALVITAIGMSLLFLALLLFYGLLTLATRQRQSRPPSGPPVAATKGPSHAGQEMMYQAAALAVALARAEAEQASSLVSAPPGPTDLQIPSQWWSLHHQRRLARNQSRQRAP
jgi:hypothetical protein